MNNTMKRLCATICVVSTAMSVTACEKKSNEDSMAERSVVQSTTVTVQTSAETSSSVTTTAETTITTTSMTTTTVTTTQQDESYKIKNAEDLINVKQKDYLDMVEGDVTTSYIIGGSVPFGTGLIGKNKLTDYIICYNVENYDYPYGESDDLPLAIEVTDNGIIGNDLNGNPIKIGITYNELLSTINCLGCIEHENRCIANINGNYWELVFEINDQMNARYDEVYNKYYQGYGNSPVYYDGYEYNPVLKYAVYKSETSFENMISKYMTTATINTDGTWIRNAPDDKEYRKMWLLNKGDSIWWLYGEGITTDQTYLYIYYYTEQGYKFGYIPAKYVNY